MNRHPGPAPLTLQQIGLARQEIELLDSLCNGKPALIEDVAFFSDRHPERAADILLVDLDRPEALEELHRATLPTPRHLVLVTSGRREHCRYPTLQRPLSFMGLRDTLASLFPAPADPGCQAAG